MAYTSNRYRAHFTELPGSNTRNGTPALSSLMGNIMDNQQWLAFTDIPATQFIYSEITGAATLTVDVEVPPGGLYAAFYFLAVKNAYKAGSVTDITVTGVTAATSGNVASVDANLTIDRAQWISFNGPPTQAEYSTRVVKLLTLADLTFQKTTVTIDIEAGCSVYYGYYKVIPGRVY